MSKSNSDQQQFDRLADLGSRLDAAGCRDACFELSALPCSAFSDETSGDEDGFAWCPQGLPNGYSVHLTSSRLSRQLERFPGWFDAIRTFAANFKPEGTFLLTAEGMTADPWIVRISELFDQPVVRVQRFPKRVSAQWIEQQQSVPSQRVRTIWVEGANLSLDDLLITIASEVRILRVRKNGNVYGAV